MKKGNSLLSGIIGTSCLILGAVVMLAWFYSIPTTNVIVSSHALPQFESAIYFFVTGATLILCGMSFLAVFMLIIPTENNAEDHNERRNAIINTMVEGAIVFKSDGSIEEFNKSAQNIFGYQADEIRHKNIALIIPALARNNDQTTIANYLQIQSEQILQDGSLEVTAIHREGHQITLQLKLTELILDKELNFIGCIRDISQSKIIESRLKESEEKFRSAFNSSAIGMAIVSNDGYFIQTNQALGKILGYSEDELLKSNFQSIIVSQDLENAVKMRQELLDNKIAYFQCEERYHHKNGNTVWLSLSYSMIRSSTNEPLYFVVQVQDITDQKKSAEQLAYQAFYDSLTGLANRSQLEHGINNLINYSKRYHKKFAVFFLDLDKFKEINDTFGHNVGDEILITVAERLKNAIRKTDIAARLGGDEFVLVMTDVINFEYISSFAEKLISVLSQPIKINGNDFLITTSIGVSIYPIDGNDYQTLIKNSDLALYQSKEQGRNNYQFCTPEMAKTMKDRLDLEHALKAAIIHEEFQLSYQPQIELHHGTVYGMEAFIRWTSSQIGVVPPQKMIPIAEETGLIIPLTEWVIRTAFQQIKDLKEAGFWPLHISINLSVRQFMCDELATWIQSSSENTGIPPSILNLEVKERLLLQIPETTLLKLQLLRQQGIKIIIDDFGTGYSSLSYLQKAIVDGIKIDDSLVQSIPTNANNRNMISAIINLSKTLGITSIAEGVETIEQYKFLHEHQCDIIQGYFISKPAANIDLLKFLKERDGQHQPESVD